MRRLAADQSHRKELMLCIGKSAPCSRQFGFGLHLSVEQLWKVNEMRQNQKHGDEEAAIYLLGSADKKDLDSLPFVW
jgi:hypothetical protein